MIPSRLPSLRLATKLPMMVVLITLTAMGVIGLLSLDRAKAALWDGLEAALSAKATARAEALSGWIEERQADLALLGLDPTLAENLQRLARSLSPAAPLLPGEDYETIHAELHPFYSSTLEERGYGDLYLIEAGGQVVFSVSGRTEVGTNVLEGRHAQSPLGSAVRDALSRPPRSVGLTDFAPYAPLGDRPAAFMAMPVVQDGRTLGALAVLMTPEDVTRMLWGETGPGQGSDLYLIGPDGLARNASEHTGGLPALASMPDLPHRAAAVAGEAGFFTESVGLNGEPAVAIVRPLSVAQLGWSLILEENREAALAPLVTLRREIFLSMAFAAVASALLGWAASRQVTQPLAAVADSTLALLEKRYDLAIAGEGRKDEFGDLAAALARVRGELALAEAQAADQERAKSEQDRVVAALGAALSRLADGDLTRPVEDSFGSGYEGLRHDVNSTMATLNDMLESIVENAARIAQKAGEISASSDDLSRRTESQAATLEETAAALDELTSSVKSAALGAGEVDGIVDKAREEAEQSGSVVRDAVAAMSEIERSSNEIGQIIGVIDDFAFQTNLLALNAGVEAARAGEAGKGFAVVASEVRTLAQRSSDAARQIKSLIGGSAGHVREGVELVGRAGEALTSIVGRVAHISELVSDIATGAKEQAAGLSEINAGVIQLDQVTQENAAMVEQSTDASHALNREAKQLAEVVGRFRLRGGVQPAEALAAPAPAGGSFGTSVAIRREARPRFPRLQATAAQLRANSSWQEF